LATDLPKGVLTPTTSLLMSTRRNSTSWKVAWMASASVFSSILRYLKISVLSSQLGLELAYEMSESITSKKTATSGSMRLSGSNTISWVSCLTRAYHSAAGVCLGQEVHGSGPVQRLFGRGVQQERAFRREVGYLLQV
jgi:hypothetical protein